MSLTYFTEHFIPGAHTTGHGSTLASEFLTAVHLRQVSGHEIIRAVPDHFNPDFSPAHFLCKMEIGLLDHPFTRSPDHPMSGLA